MMFPKHRHFIALPITLLCLALLSGLHVTLGADVLSSHRSEYLRAAEEERAFRLGIGMQGILHERSLAIARNEEMTVELVRGSLDVRIPGYGKVDVGGTTLHVFAGMITVLQDAAGLSVTALDAPALVVEGSTHLLLSPGTQLRRTSEGVVTTSRVPTDWLLERRAALLALALDTQLSERPASLGEHSSIPERSRAIESALLRGDVDGPALESLLSLAKSLDSSLPLPSLLALRLAMEDGIARDDTILSSTVESGGFGLASAEAIAVIAGEHLPLPTPFVDVWLKAAERAAIQDPERTITALAPLTARLPAIADQHGFPKYALSWRDAERSLLQVASPLLSSDHPGIRQMMASVQQVPALPTANEDPPDKAASEFIQDAASLQALAREELLRSGAMLSADSSFTAIGKAQVRIEHVYFATVQGDARFDLTYDVETKEVSDIVREGQRLPNTLPLLAFVNGL